MVAGLCRVLANRKIKVAPFKPQNMALNSAVTHDGGEIGRAQALQATACYLEPHSDFNPILLKPSSDTGAQVIVHGKVLSSMQAAQYHSYKKQAMRAVMESHTRLTNQYDKIIVEGAGSPAEINLRDNDIANMGFAEEADCPVILIADIDKGGVFAHLVGTLDLLSQTEQNRVIGFIINKFRGDPSLLDSGLHWLEQRTAKPVLAVVPYLKDLFLDAEDAISSMQVGAKQSSEPRLKVVVPVLPRISNHTDFDALRLHPKVDLQWVSIEQDLPAADLIILPGSKNALEDLNALKTAGWQTKLNRHLRYGGKLIGICGGYQMLGDKITDPHQIESNQLQSNGFAFFKAETILHPEKQLNRVQANFCIEEFDESSLQGYEIHCGQTRFADHSHRPLLTVKHSSKSSSSTAEPRTDGAINQDNNVLGTYLHGLFDSPHACNNLLEWAGLNSHSAVALDQHREAQLERLADWSGELPR